MDRPELCIVPKARGDDIVLVVIHPRDSLELPGELAQGFKYVLSIKLIRMVLLQRRRGDDAATIQQRNRIGSSVAANNEISQETLF